MFGFCAFGGLCVAKSVSQRDLLVCFARWTLTFGKQYTRSVSLCIFPEVGLGSKVIVPESSDKDGLYEQVPDVAVCPRGRAQEVRVAMREC